MAKWVAEGSGKEKSFICYPSRVEGGRTSSRACMCTSRVDTSMYSYIRILTKRIAGKYQRPTVESVYNLVCVHVCLCLCTLNDTPRRTDLLETPSACSFPELNELRSECLLSRGASTDSPPPGPQLPRSLWISNPSRLGKSRWLSFLHFQLSTLRRDMNIGGYSRRYNALLVYFSKHISKINYLYIQKRLDVYEIFPDVFKHFINGN